MRRRWWVLVGALVAAFVTVGIAHAFLSPETMSQTDISQSGIYYPANSGNFVNMRTALMNPPWPVNVIVSALTGNISGNPNFTGNPVFSGAPTGVASSMSVTPTGGTTARLLADQSSDVANVLNQTGSDASGASDSSAAINAAAALLTAGGQAKSVYLPAGSYKVQHQINLANGQCLYGDGIHNTVLLIDSSFSTTDSAIVSLSGRERAAPCVHDVDFVFKVPADLQLTVTGTASSGQATIAVSTCTGVTTGYYVYDQTTTAAIKMNSSSPATWPTVSSCSANTLTLSNNLSATANTSDILDISPPRSAFTTLAAGCSVATGGNGCQYPPAILSSNSNRVVIYNVRMESGCWDGINITNSSPSAGGAIIHDIENGCIDIGLNLDNNLDSTTVSNFKSWNYGLTTGQAWGVWADGSTFGIQAGRVDGFVMSNYTGWFAGINVTSAAGSSADPWSWSSMMFDTAPVLIANDFDVACNGCTWESSFNRQLLNVTTGKFHCASCQLRTTSGTTPMGLGASATLYWDNGHIQNDNGGQPIMTGSGFLLLHNSAIQDHGATCTNPLFNATATTFTVEAIGNTVSSGCGGTKNFIKVTGDNAGSNIAHNNLQNGFTIVVPTWTSTAQVGYYEGNVSQTVRTVNGATDTGSGTDRFIALNDTSAGTTESITACAANNNGQQLQIRANSSAATHADTVSPLAGTINGAASLTLSTNSQINALICDGANTNWAITATH